MTSYTQQHNSTTTHAFSDDIHPQTPAQEDNDCNVRSEVQEETYNVGEAPHHHRGVRMRGEEAGRKKGTMKTQNCSFVLHCLKVIHT